MKKKLKLSPLFEQAYWQDQHDLFAEAIRKMWKLDRAVKKDDDMKWASVGDTIIWPKYRHKKMITQNVTEFFRKNLIP